MERLARDQLPRVRAVLPKSIKSLDCIPKYIVLTLARDAESMVAAPVLEYSPLLSDTDLIEIIATAKVEEIISAVARRKPVNPEVADAIVASLDIPAISTLLANPDAKVREKAMDSIVEQAEKIEEFQQPLTMRTDLSKRAIWRLASFVGASLIEQLMMRYGLDEDIKHQLNKELRARLQEDSQKESTPLDKAKKDVAAALDGGQARRSLCRPLPPMPASAMPSSFRWRLLPRCPKRLCARSSSQAPPSRRLRWSGMRDLPCGSRSRSRAL